MKKKKPLVVSFSGGRTSGCMCDWVKKHWGDKYDLHFVFANTGQEHEATLEFVNLCDINMGLNLTWIEADIKTKGVGTSYKIINFESANREGKPFEDMVKKFGLPNKAYPHCNRELKTEPMKKWANDMFGSDYLYALGIRVDEPKRLTQSTSYNEKLYPLAYENPMTKGDVINWWKKQNYDLMIPEHLGNCMWCWKKSSKKLRTLAQDYPQIFEFPKMLEEKYSHESNYDKKEERKMFRGYKTTADIFNDAKLPFDKFIESQYHQGTLGLYNDECAEECGSVIL